MGTVISVEEAVRMLGRGAIVHKRGTIEVWLATWEDGQTLLKILGHPEPEGSEAQVLGVWISWPSRWANTGERT